MLEICGWYTDNLTTEEEHRHYIHPNVQRRVIDLSGLLEKVEKLHIQLFAIEADKNQCHARIRLNYESSAHLCECNRAFVPNYGENCQVISCAAIEEAAKIIGGAYRSIRQSRSNQQYRLDQQP